MSKFTLLNCPFKEYFIPRNEKNIQDHDLSDPKWFYLFYSASKGAFKIGYTERALSQRIYEHARNYDVYIIYAAYILDSATLLEDAIRAFFKSKQVGRKNSEWFKFDYFDLSQLYETIDGSCYVDESRDNFSDFVCDHYGGGNIRIFIKEAE